jgi:hypothetical protein
MHFREDFEKGIGFMQKINDVKIDDDLEPLHNVLNFYEKEEEGRE